MRRGIGEYQVRKSRKTAQAILDALKDGEWHRYTDLQKDLQISTSALSKHLKTLERGLVERKRDFDSGKYPNPVYYRLKSRFLELEKESKEKADILFPKHKLIRDSIHWFNFHTDLLLISLLREYLMDPIKNEVMFNQATEYNIISLFRRYIEAVKLKLKELSDKGENTEKLLSESQDQLLKDYNFLIKEIVETSIDSSFSSMEDFKQYLTESMEKGDKQ